MGLSTFEDEVAPLGKRQACALGNVRHDFTVAGKSRRGRIAAVADAYYDGWRKADPRPRILALNLFLPGACNATCPGICFTDWRRRGAGYDEGFLAGVLWQFAGAGGRLVRVVGLGEPTISRLFPALCANARSLRLDLIVFTNGIAMTERVLREYRGNRRLRFYVKHWSDDVLMQDRLVCPRGNARYRYEDGPLGPASKVFYDLYRTDPERVGFQVMTSALNREEARAIVTGPKAAARMFVEPFFPAGCGRGREALVVNDAPSIDGWPTRASYLAVVNHRGCLQAGTFVAGEEVGLDRGLAGAWRSVFIERETFFLARYHGSADFSESMLRK